MCLCMCLWCVPLSACEREGDRCPHLFVVVVFLIRILLMRLRLNCYIQVCRRSGREGEGNGQLLRLLLLLLLLVVVLLLLLPLPPPPLLGASAWRG
jgi:hypothetical protein